MHHHQKNQNKVFLLNSQTVGQMAKLNLQPIAISVLETQASTKKLDCRKKWLAVQNVVDQVWIVQWCALENQQRPFYVVNEVTLRDQNSSLKFCYPLELHTQLKMGLDLLLLKIWGL